MEPWWRTHVHIDSSHHVCEWLWSGSNVILIQKTTTEKNCVKIVIAVFCANFIFCLFWWKTFAHGFNMLHKSGSVDNLAHFGLKKFFLLRNMTSFMSENDMRTGVLIYGNFFLLRLLQLFNCRCVALYTYRTILC